MSCCLQQQLQDTDVLLLDHPGPAECPHADTSHANPMPSSSSSSSRLCDELASRILSTMAHFLQVASPTRLTINQEMDQRTLIRADARQTLTTFRQLISDHRDNVAASTSSSSPRDDLYRVVRRIVFYVSLSNWCVVFRRIKQRLSELCSTLSTLQGDATPSTVDLQFLECCAFNAKRLVLVLSGIMELYKW